MAGAAALVPARLDLPRALPAGAAATGALSSGSSSPIVPSAHRTVSPLYAAGSPLRDAVPARSLPLPVVQHLAAALDFARGRGIVHRDL
ncbi:MAG: hypothetical protein RMM58_11080 [Chloroflexota bacterium]|nr:hypothetical protein [Dehalococcoidia bacterium]MDW8254406.1 hypothetical protein [Chloroflexota bacterium]